MEIRELCYKYEVSKKTIDFFLNKRKKPFNILPRLQILDSDNKHLKPNNEYNIHLTNLLAYTNPKQGTHNTISRHIVNNWENALSEMIEIRKLLCNMYRRKRVSLQRIHNIQILNYKCIFYTFPDDIYDKNKLIDVFTKENIKIKFYEVPRDLIYNWRLYLDLKICRRYISNILKIRKRKLDKLLDLYGIMSLIKLTDINSEHIDYIYSLIDHEKIKEYDDNHTLSQSEINEFRNKVYIYTDSQFQYDIRKTSLEEVYQKEKNNPYLQDVIE